MSKQADLTLVTSDPSKGEKRTVTGKVVPVRTKSKKLRDYLTKDEVERLRKVAKDGRYGHRDSTAILTAFRHGLRVSELCALQWSDIDFDAAKMHIRRLKGSDDAVHTIHGDELRALRRLQKESGSSFVFTNERKAPLSPDGFRKSMNRWGVKAGFEWSISPHTLRHSCGYHMVNKGVDLRLIQAWLGHRDISSTIRYTKLSSKRFETVNSIW